MSECKGPVEGQYRQGDVLLERVDPTTMQPVRLPQSATVQPRDPQGRIVLEYGEVTGHAHAVLDREAEAFLAGVQQYLVVSGDAPVTLRHEEHGAIALEPGVYQRGPQFEYDEGEERRVAD